MLNNRDYMLDVCVRMAHHSTAIEGNTLTQQETASIILDNYIPRAIREREFYEVRNYKILLPAFIESLQNQEVIDTKLIKHLHSITMKDLHYEAGYFKIAENMIIGAEFEPTKPALVPMAIKNMCDNLTYKLAHSKDELDKVKAILESHIEFEKIHPFADGNGRIGRLLIIYSCFEHHLTPIIIPQEQKDRYIACLHHSKLEEFVMFAQEIQAEEKERYKKFMQSK